ncbi:KaiC domain-containing protein [Halosegnis sp.]|uniref:KaiC domain-containing protein n=1 Tax=Halosegnis sp. TaxID=2864959 RepID=UPI0035D524E0
MSDDGDADEEDWFEAALRGDDEAETETEAEAESSPEPDLEPNTDDEVTAQETGNPFEEAGGSSDTDPFGGGTSGSDPFADAGSGGADADPFGGDSAGEDPFGGDSAGDDLFDDDFGAAFEGGGGEEFDEEFESDIPRIDTGVEGLDEMIQGGVPARALMVVIGSAGTGKTTFGLQFLRHGLNHDEKAVYITLEETREAILDAASEKGWDFEAHVDEDRLAIVDLDPVEMANSLSSIRSDLPRLIDDFGAERLVLDSVSLLEMMYDDQAERRTEVFDFTKALKQAGVSTMLTSEASEGNPYASRHGIIEYLTDAVFVLQYVRSEFQETRLAVEIQKIRNANHSRETKPYEITEKGISVYQQANIF